MAVGNYIYVGKSRIRKLHRERRRKRILERRKERPRSGESLDLGNVKYNQLPPCEAENEELTFEYDPEADSSSTGSSEFEDLLPLVDLDSALDLRPHTGKLSPSLKMPFEFFKKKEVKKEENVFRQEISIDVNGGEKEGVVKEETSLVSKEPVKEYQAVTDEKQGNDLKPVSEETEKEMVKEQEPAENLQTSGKSNEKLVLDEYKVGEDEKAETGLLCCNIL